MPRSMLVYRAVPENPGACWATIVALHARGGDLDQLRPLCGSLGAGIQVVAPQAARMLDPAHAGTDGSPIGFTWYFSQTPSIVEPATFGESLWQLEQFVRDVRDRQGTTRPVLILGLEQGASLGLALATLAPDWVAGVAALGGHLPRIRGWSPPVVNACGLPVLLVRDPGDPTVPAELIAQTASSLRTLNMSVEIIAIPGVLASPATARPVVRAWLDTAVARRAHPSAS
jgi:predicted esterase